MNDPLPLIVANLKANKTWQEMVSWLDLVAPKAQDFAGTVVVCPSLPFIVSAHEKIQSANWRILLGIQNISHFGPGPYTGEVAATQIADLCQYVIIGHSERRQNFSEGYKILEQKVANAHAAGINSIFCVQDETTPIPQGVELVAYEPIFAVGTGNPDTPQNAQAMAEKLKTRSHYTVLYGGSVTGEIVHGFLKKDTLDGVLVGAASLDPASAIGIIESATY